MMQDLFRPGVTEDGPQAAGPPYMISVVIPVSSLDHLLGRGRLGLNKITLIVSGNW